MVEPALPRPLCVHLLIVIDIAGSNCTDGLTWWGTPSQHGPMVPMPPSPLVGFPSIRTGSHLWGVPPMDRLPFVGHATSTHGPPSGGVPVDQDRLPLVGHATEKDRLPFVGHATTVRLDRLPCLGHATSTDQSTVISITPCLICDLETITIAVPRHLHSPVRSPFLAGVQPHRADLMLGARAPTAQHGLPFWRECNRAEQI